MINYKAIVAGGIVATLLTLPSLIVWVSDDTTGDGAIDELQVDSITFTAPDYGFNKVNERFKGRFAELDASRQQQAEQEATKPEEAASPEPKPEPKFGLTPEQEQQQQGTLDALFVGEQQLTLRGVFSGQQQFAVLEIKSLRTQVQTIERVKLGDVIHDYRVTNMTNDSVSLETAGRKLTLMLYKPKV